MKDVDDISTCKEDNAFEAAIRMIQYLFALRLIAVFLQHKVSNPGIDRNSGDGVAERMWVTKKCGSLRWRMYAFNVFQTVSDAWYCRTGFNKLETFSIFP